MKKIDATMTVVSKKWHKFDGFNSEVFKIKCRDQYQCWNTMAETRFNFVANRIAALPEIMELLEKLKFTLEKNKGNATALHLEILEYEKELSEILHRAKHGS